MDTAANSEAAPGLGESWDQNTDSSTTTSQPLEVK
jgi:hypothetical protein